MTAVAAPVAAGSPEGTPAAPVVPPAAAVPAAAVVPPAVPPVVPVAAPVAPVAPVVYALALPAGSLLDPKATERTEALAKANGWSPEVASAVLAAHHAEATAMLDTLKAAESPGGELYKARVAELNAAALAHPALGNGDPQKLTDAQLRSQLVLNKYGPELVPLLDKAGDGSRPELLLMLTRFASAIGEKSLVLPDSGPPKAPPLTDAQAMYPDMYLPKQ